MSPAQTQYYCIKNVFADFHNIFATVKTVIGFFKDTPCMESQLKEFIEEICEEQAFKRLLSIDLYRWLMEEKAYVRFLHLMPNMIAFLKTNANSMFVWQLENPEFVSKLSFVTDVMIVLDKHREQISPPMLSLHEVIAMARQLNDRLQILKQHLEDNNFSDFEHLKKSDLNVVHQFNRIYVKIIDDIIDHNNCEESAVIKEYGIIVQRLFERCPNGLGPCFIRELTLLYALRAKYEPLYNNLTIFDFGNILHPINFQNLKLHINRYQTFFATTNKNESAFGHLKVIQSRERNCLTFENIERLLKICTRNQNDFYEIEDLMVANKTDYLRNQREEQSLNNQ